MLMGPCSFSGMIVSENGKPPKFIGELSLIEQNHSPFESGQSDQIFHEREQLNLCSCPEVPHCHMTNLDRRNLCGELMHCASLCYYEDGIGSPGIELYEEIIAFD